MKKPRLKSLVSWANRFTWTYFLFALFSRAEEGMMGGKADKHLPPNAGAHSFTRNRTRGSDFPPFFSPDRKSPPSFPEAARLLFGSRKGVFLVVARVRFFVKPLLYWQSACVTTLPHLQSTSFMSHAPLASLSKGRDKGDRDVREAATTLCRRERSNVLKRQKSDEAMRGYTVSATAPIWWLVCSRVWQAAPGASSS